MTEKIAKTDEQWRAELDPNAYAVLRHGATEPPFTGAYTYAKEDGLYRCGGCGNALFSSETKYDSGSGWPSFTEAVSEGDGVELKTDVTHGMVRTEVLCAKCGGHLGHVFDDGPADAGGQRFCINSAALALEPEA